MGNHLRTDWTKEEIAEIFNSPILDLMYRSATVHRQFHDPREVQVCTLLSVKTGGCPEDCGCCLLLKLMKRKKQAALAFAWEQLGVKFVITATLIR